MARRPTPPKPQGKKQPAKPAQPVASKTQALKPAAVPTRTKTLRAHIQPVKGAAANEQKRAKLAKSQAIRMRPQDLARTIKMAIPAPLLEPMPSPIPLATAADVAAQTGAAGMAAVAAVTVIAPLDPPVVTQVATAAPAPVTPAPASTAATVTATAPATLTAAPPVPAAAPAGPDLTTPAGRATALLDEALPLLEHNKNDAAIEVLRRLGPPNDPRLCAALARAYSQRGDTKGDVYSCAYFAGRAIELGLATPELYAYQAVSAFRKEQYAIAVKAFEHFVSESSLPATQFVYGLALAYTQQVTAAQTWLARAAARAPAEPRYQQASELVRHALNRSRDTGAHLPPAGNLNMFATLIDTLKATGAADLDAPHRHNAVSKLRGHGTHPKDFYWLAKNIPCQAACPAGTNIPEYLNAIYAGDYDRAYRINLVDNVFPALLGRVCSRPCESECRHGWDGLGKSVAICWSKRSAADHKDKGPVVLPQLFAATKKRVAVVGAGVGGLAAARQLALLGHSVTVYEKHQQPGGMLNQGIPIFRLPRELIAREISQVQATGVEIRCGIEVGKDLPLAKLLDEHHAVVMAAGTLRPNLLPLPGSELKGIEHGLPFLLEVNEKGRTACGKQVLVIGGGFTAMDCARSAWRLGAATRVMYRRSKNEMLITPGELEELEHEGIPMEFMVAPVAFVGDAAGHVRAMRFVRTQMGEPDASGRRRPMDIPGSEFEVPCDAVILATGQFPDTKWIDPALRADLVGKDQWLLSGKDSATAKRKLFVAGDFALGASTLIQAIAHGKQTARAVDTFLMGQERLKDVAVVSDAKSTGRIREMDYVPPQPMPVIPVSERTLTAEVETGFTPVLATDETQRCYLCHYKYEIDNDKCIYCDWCIKAKPRPNCIVKVSELVYDDQDRITGFVRSKAHEDTKLIFINQEDCIRCNACVDACPVDCISVQKVSRGLCTHDGVLVK